MLELELIVIERTQETDFFPVSMKLIPFLSVISFHVVYTQYWYPQLNRFHVQCRLTQYPPTVISVYWVCISQYMVTRIDQYQESDTGILIQEDHVLN